MKQQEKKKLGEEEKRSRNSKIIKKRGRGRNKMTVEMEVKCKRKGKNLHKERGSGKMSRPRREEYPARGPPIERSGRIGTHCIITQRTAVLYYHNLPIVHRKTEANHM